MRRGKILVPHWNIRQQLLLLVKKMNMRMRKKKRSKEFK